MSRAAIRTLIQGIAQLATPPLTVYEYVPVAEPINDLFIITAIAPSLEGADTLPIGGGGRAIDHTVVCEIITTSINEQLMAQQKDALYQGFVTQVRAKAKTCPITLSSDPVETSLITALGWHDKRNAQGIRLVDDWSEENAGDTVEGLKMGVLLVEIDLTEQVWGV